MREQGTALLMTVLAMAALSAIGMSLALGSSVDRLTAGNHRDVLVNLNAAESALAIALRDLDRAPDWTPVLQGTVQSTFLDGAPGLRALSSGASIDLMVLTNLITCGRRTACSDALIADATATRPWGANNPRWRLFGHGRVNGVDPLVGDSPYLVIWIGDDAGETDGDREADGPRGRGGYVVRVRAEAFGPGALRSAIECTAARDCSALGCEPGIRVQSWHLATPYVP